MEASVCWGIGLQCAEVVGCWAGRVLGVDGGELWDWSFRALCVHSRAGYRVVRGWAFRVLGGVLIGSWVCGK